MLLWTRRTWREGEVCRTAARSRVGELDDDLDVVRLAVQRVHERFRLLAPRQQARQPRRIRPSEACPALYQCRLLALTLPTMTLFWSTIVAAMSAVDVADRPAARADAGEADDAAGAHDVDRVGDDLADARALDDHVGLEPHVGGATGVIRRPQGTNQIGLGARFDAIENVDLEPVLLANQRRQQADRSGAGDEHRVRLPERALADRDGPAPRPS